MKWRKLGRVFCPCGERPWMAGYAALPFAEPIDHHEVRVYFSSRDARQRSHLGWVDVDLRRPDAPLRIAREPLLAPAAPGFFDDNGVTLCWITPAARDDHLYYVGWNLSRSVPFRNALGLALRDGNGGVRRYSDGPIMDRSPHDPCFTAAGCVLHDSDQWRMWYLSCIAWIPHEGGFRHRYHIKHALSNDGIAWERDGTICIDFQSEAEYAISRPSVIRERDGYRMWYSYRGASYRIGYAVSHDGLRWERRDEEAGIDLSPSGWDSDMLEYPHVFDHGGARYMLYNGNGYGRSGFGLAVLEQD